MVGLRDPFGRLVRWALRLQEFTICYKTGRHHADTDCLSRLPQPTTLCDADNFLAAIDDTAFLDLATFREEQRNDCTLDDLFDSATQPISSPGFIVRDGLLYKKNYMADGARLLLVVPKKEFGNAHTLGYA